MSARFVCRDCNSGWMNDIETAARPFVRKMVMGQALTLDTREQESVASWLALRALGARYTDNPVVPPERDQLDYFYTHRLPPKACYQWITAYKGGKPFHYQGNDIGTVSDIADPDPPDIPHGILMTLAIGYLAVKLIWMSGAEPTEPDPPNLLRIWPIGTSAITWPPSRIINDRGLDHLMRMFLD